MTSDLKDFIKEAFKTEIELMKIFSFLIALVSAVTSMTLGDYFAQGLLHQFLFYAGIIALAFVLIIFIIFVWKILRRLKQLKTTNYDLGINYWRYGCHYIRNSSLYICKR